MPVIPNVRLPRRDRAQQAAEPWRPPVFAQSCTASGRILAAIRRLLDLQAASLWRDLREVLPQCSGVVVDVGCGAQPYRALLGREVRYIGIDNANAKQHFGYEMPDTIYYDGARWPIDDRSADVVLCTETLEHVFDTGQFLSELARVLRQDGLAILTVPFSARYHFIPFDYWRFTPASLRLELTAVGLSNVRVYARGNAVTVACYKSMALVLPLLFAPATAFGWRLFRGIIGVATMPMIVLIAAIAHLSLLMDGGDDCLGYTVLATRNAEGA